jgi:hypothetical protein
MASFSDGGDDHVSPGLYADRTVGGAVPHRRAGGVLLKVHELRSDGKKLQRDQWAFLLEQTQPGVYTFDISREPLAEPGRYSISIDDLKTILAETEFTVE